MEITGTPPVRCPNCGNYYAPGNGGGCPYCGDTSVIGAAHIGKTEPASASWSGNDNVYSSSTLPADDNSGHSSGNFQPTHIGGVVNVPGGSEPVVGWLVCIDGPARGMDYRLHSGYNNIGREEGDIRISGDMQISRREHARVAFDADGAIFYIAPGSGRNIIKVNGKAVLNAVELANYDIISIGTSKLIFVALCGERFMWGRE